MASQAQNLIIRLGLLTSLMSSSPGLLATKLHLPSLPAKWIERPHLILRLNEGLELKRPLTLVSAPAGYGKTTCISEWVRSLDHWPVAWLSLELSENDPGLLFAYLVAALQQVDGELGREIGRVLHSGQIPPSEVIATTLINDILKMDCRFILILDDLHVIRTRSILQVLERLIANPPPPLHLVLSTREDPPLPLAKLRASNQMTEIRARDLRFTRADSGRFLTNMIDHSLSEADIAAVEERTEGWITGLQLVGLAIPDKIDPSGFVATLGGGHRFILSYLTEQVLSQQPEEFQQFLLQTSILDRLSGELCSTVMGCEEGRILLERVYRANLFLVPLDDEGHWYRYHHLFAGALRELRHARRMDETAELHRRASHWYAQAGMVSDAIQHALAAEDYGLAVDLLESHAMDMIMQGYAKTVHRWVQDIPEQWRSHSPRTNLAFAWMHLLRGAYGQVATYLEQSRVALVDSQMEPQSREEKSSLKAEWLVMQSLILYKQGKATQGKATAARALAIAPDQDTRVRSLAYYALASTYQLIGDYPRATEAYQLAIAHGREAANLVSEMLSTVGLALMAFERGQLHLAYEISAPVADRLDQSRLLPPIGAVVYGVLGEICYQWCRCEQARRHVLSAAELSALGGYNSGKITCLVLLARIFLIEGDVEAAAREIQRAVDLMPLDVPSHVRHEVVAEQVRIYLARDRPDAARLALQGHGFAFLGKLSFPDLSPSQATIYSTGLLYNSGLRVLLYEALIGGKSDGLMAGIDVAGVLFERALADQSILVALEALLLRAQMYAALGNGGANLAASQADYVHALELGEPEGLVSVFVVQGACVAQALTSLLKSDRLGAAQSRFVERIMGAFSRSKSQGSIGGEKSGPATPPSSRQRPHGSRLIDPLTERELEVLHLMAGGRKYREIADNLVISLNTVRFHVKTIYGKLGVNNRLQAIETARRFGLFEIPD